VFTEFTESWLIDAVRKEDRDRYLAAMFCPPLRRAAAFGVAAFHAEIAAVRERVSEPQLGHIRLLWWREALERAHAADDAEAAPLLRLLAMQRVWPDLRPHLLDLIDAHARVLDEPPLADADSARRRVAGVTAPLAAAFAIAAGLSDWADSPVAGDAALGHGLTVLLRGTASALQRGRSPWAEHLADPQVRSALALQVADIAEAAIAAATAQRPPRQAFPLIVPALLARQHLHRLRRVGGDSLDARFSAPSRVTPGLLWAWLRCRK
jgi:phytoene synthase